MSSPTWIWSPSGASWLQPLDARDAPRPVAVTHGRNGNSPAWLVALALGLVVPTEFSVYLGGLRLSPYRLVLMAAFFPCLWTLLARRVGRLLLTDVAMVLHVVWAACAIGVRSGAGAGIESGGIYAMEALGAYLVGRTCVRNATDTRRFAQLYFASVAGIALLALPECVTGKHFVHDIAGSLFGNRPPTNMEGRLGLTRAYGPFDHPILYGTFCAASLALAVAAVPKGPGSGCRALWRSGLVTLATFASLSSGCLMALFVQFGLLAYRRVTAFFRGRWILLAGVAASGYGLVSMISERSGLRAVLWYITFDRHTATYRISIWEHASQNIANYPLFGIGKADWIRPVWMPKSVDSLWLATTLDFGLPGMGFLLLAFLGAIVGLARGSRAVADEPALTRALGMTLIALAFVGLTVHFWNNVFVLLCLLLGMAAWPRTTTRNQGVAQ